MLARRIRRLPRKVDSKTAATESETENKGRKQKRITKSKTSKKAASGSVTKTSPTTDDKKLPVRPAKKSKPAAPHLPSSHHTNIKKTIFKTKSKDHLPLPAFGFIDVCFCIDATGSMSS